MAVKKITKRWLFNSLGVILVILLATTVAFSVGIRSFYYNGVRQAILSRSSVITTLLEKNSQDSSTNFAAEMRTVVETFQDRQLMELMAIDTAGQVIITSSGFQTQELGDMPDFTSALAAPSGIGEYQGKLGGENVMAISVIPPMLEEDLGAIRFVASLELVDRQIALSISAVLLVGAVVLCFVVFSSSYFISSIVNPVGEVGDTARKIAQGDFKVRLQKKNDDEIGELSDTINYMAQELENADKLKNDFISSVSHELRTPLTAIKGWGETLLAEEEIDRETLATGMNVILRETDRLSDMVEELLDFSRMQSGRLGLVMAKMDVLAELEEAVLMYTERAKREGVDLHYDEPDLMVPVLGDRNRMRQVFINILDNALKYSDPGGSIAVSASVSGVGSGPGGPRSLLIRVQDRGCGISPEDLPKIKQKFYKANLTRRGSGIGLAVADEIVTMHGGQLDVASTLGVGTTVTISLPIVDRKSE